MWESTVYYLLLALESAVGVVGIRLYEEPPYKVITQLGERIEIRRYAPRLAAEVALPNLGEATRGDAFRLLFNYIAGANRAQSGADKIAMTVPVVVREADRVAMTTPVETGEENGLLRMRFFLPAKYNGDNAPQPLDERVKLLTVPTETVATLRYSGSGNDFADRERELLSLLAQSGWQPLGPPYTLYYDAPFTLPFARRNEATVAVAARPLATAPPR